MRAPLSAADSRRDHEFAMPTSWGQSESLARLLAGGAPGGGGGRDDDRRGRDDDRRGGGRRRYDSRSPSRSDSYERRRRRRYSDSRSPSPRSRSPPRRDRRDDYDRRDRDRRDRRDDYYDRRDGDRRDGDRRDGRGDSDRAPPRPAEDDPLPGDWKAHTDPASGKTYYYSTAENRTTWTRPQPPPRADAADGAAPPAVEDAAGRPIDL